MSKCSLELKQFIFENLGKLQNIDANDVILKK